MSGLLITIDLLLTLAAGASVTGLLRSDLRFEERIGIAIVIGLVMCSALSFALSLVVGLTVLSILAAPVLIGAAAWAIGRRNVLESWQASRGDLAKRWRNREIRSFVVLAVVMAAVITFIFARAMSDDAGNLVTGYWLPDWGEHLTNATSFSAGGNLPPGNPIFAGQPLYYPFLPDFQSAMLLRLGAGEGIALAAPQGLLCIVAACMIVTFAERLGARRSVGVIAVIITFLGGGLGFVGALGDACAQSRPSISGGSSSDQCTLAYVAAHPVDAVGITADTVHNLPGLVTNQTRAYDGLLTDEAQRPLPNQRWYTPLLAWWLPQRSLVMGFPSLLVIFTLVHASVIRGTAPRRDVILAGVLAGLLPLVHVHSFIVLAIVIPGFVVWRRRRAWMLFAGVTAIIVAPRLLQLLGAPKGTAALGNQYPWVEPGWVSKAVEVPADLPKSLSALGQVVGGTLTLPVNGTWWGFWIGNLGVAVPLCVLVCLFAVVRLTLRYLSPPRAEVEDETGDAPSTGGPRGHPRILAAATTMLRPFPNDLQAFALCTLPVFLVANVVVFQSWDWDNTKLFVFWYFGASLLIAALAVHGWRALFARSRPAPSRDRRITWGLRGISAAAAAVMLSTVLTTGVLVTLRMVPWQTNCSAVPADASRCAASTITGPYTMVTGSDRRMVGQLQSVTAPDAVFLTSDRFNDPVTALSGRSVVAGYTGWLWSFGIDYRQRQEDVAAAYMGCDAATSIHTCPAVRQVLSRYGISYVEIDTTSQSPPAAKDWWARQSLPEIARSDHIVIYDVRHL